MEKQINDSNIALAEIKTNKLALLENSDFDKDRILQIIKTIDAINKLSKLYKLL